MKIKHRNNEKRVLENSYNSKTILHNSNISCAVYINETFHQEINLRIGNMSNKGGIIMDTNPLVIFV